MTRTGRGFDTLRGEVLKELNNLNIRLTRCQCGRKSAAAVWACCSCRGVGVILFVNPRNLRNLSAAVAAGQVWVCRRGDRDWDTETVSQSLVLSTCSVTIHSRRVIIASRRVIITKRRGITAKRRMKVPFVIVAGRLVVVDPPMQ